jgi:hypothetical protein
LTWDDNNHRDESIIQSIHQRVEVYHIICGTAYKAIPRQQPTSSNEDASRSTQFEIGIHHIRPSNRIVWWYKEENETMGALEVSIRPSNISKTGSVLEFFFYNIKSPQRQ